MSECESQQFARRQLLPVQNQNPLDAIENGSMHHKSRGKWLRASRGGYKRVLKEQQEIENELRRIEGNASEQICEKTQRRLAFLANRKAEKLSEMRRKRSEKSVDLLLCLLARSEETRR